MLGRANFKFLHQTVIDSTDYSDGSLQHPESSADVLEGSKSGQLGPAKVQTMGFFVCENSVLTNSRGTVRHLSINCRILSTCGSRNIESFVDRHGLRSGGEATLSKAEQRPGVTTIGPQFGDCLLFWDYLTLVDIA